MVFHFGYNPSNQEPGTYSISWKDDFKNKTNSARKPEIKLPPVRSYESVVKTLTIPAPLDKVVHLVYAPNSDWFLNFINNGEGSSLDKNEMHSELQAGSKRTYEYSSCAIHNDALQLAVNKSTETIESWDLENYVEVITTTHTSYVSDDSHFTSQVRVVFAALDDNTTEVRLGTWLKVGLHPMKVAGSEQKSLCMRFVDELASADFNSLVSQPSFVVEEGALVALNPVESEQTELTSIELYAVDYEVLTPQFASPWYVYFGVALVLVEFILLRFGQAIMNMLTYGAIVRSLFDAVLFIDPIMPFINVRFKFRWKQPMNHSHLALLDRLNGEVILPVCNAREMFHNIYGVLRIERCVFFKSKPRRRFRRITTSNTTGNTDGIPPTVVRWSILFTLDTKKFYLVLRLDNRQVAR